MKKRLALVLIGLLITGCKAVFTPTNVFDNPTCAPPCWENITPGETTKADALKILTDFPAVDESINDENKPYVGFDDTLHFFLNKVTLGFLFILDDKVSMFGFENQLDLTLLDAMELFGTPESILTIHAGEFDAVTLLSPPKGVAFGYRFHLDESSEISANNEIDNVIFFDPKQYQLLLDTSILSYHQLSVDEALKKMRPWEGYGSIEQYSTTPTP